MAPIDVAAADRLHRAGFSLGDWRAVGLDGSTVHRVTADGPVGRIDVQAPTRADAFVLALAEARRLLDLG